MPDLSAAPPAASSAASPAVSPVLLAPGRRARVWRAAAGLGAWAAAALAIVALDGLTDLGTQALPLVLAAALCGWVWPAWPAAGAAVAAVAAFNWTSVPPRGTFSVSLHRDLVLLGVTLAVALCMALLAARQRRAVDAERRQAQRAARAHALAEALRTADAPADAVKALAAALAEEGLTLNAWVLGDAPAQAAHRPADPRPERPVAAAPDLPSDPPADLPPNLPPDLRAGLAQCRLDGTAYGPGTGRYEQLDGWLLPLRATARAVGAVWLPRSTTGAPSALPEGVPALCDLVGLHLDRLAAHEAAQAARRDGEAQALRATLLAAIAHDHRTPLASILSAATALQTPGEELAPAARQRLVATIVEETRQLSRLTDNALQLARLDAAPASLRADWEAVEDLTGPLMRRVREREGAARVRLRVSPGLPLVRCEAVLVVQLLENLIDNALTHTPEPAPVELLVRQEGEVLLFAVRDRGPGIPASQQARLMAAFERGDAAAADRRRGVGLGLALCAAVARAHGTTLRLRARGHGGLSIELRLPCADAPRLPEGAA